VDCLYDSADAADVDVDVEVVDELGGQVGVELGLDLDGAVDPDGWVEEDVVEELLKEDGAVGVGQLD